MSWLCQSLVAVLCLIPVWLAIGFFEKNFQIKPQVFVIWYFLGVVITSALCGGGTLSSLMPSFKSVGGVLLVGLTLGAIASILLFRAIGSAPNPGLPVAMSNVASVGVFLVAALLSRWAPSYFSSVK